MFPRYDPDEGGPDFRTTKFIADRGINSEVHVFVGDSCPKRLAKRCEGFLKAIDDVADEFRGRVQVRLHETHASSPLTDYGTELDMDADQQASAMKLARALPIVGFKSDALDFFGKNFFFHLDPLKAGQEKGDSTSLQRGCSRSNFQEESIHASSSSREMIARPEMSQIEWKTIEI